MPPEVLLETEPISFEEFRRNLYGYKKLSLQRFASESITANPNIRALAKKTLAAQKAEAEKQSNLATVKPSDHAKKPRLNPDDLIANLTRGARQIARDTHDTLKHTSNADRLWGVIHNRYDDKGKLLEPKDRPPRVSSSLQSWKDRVKSPPRPSEPKLSFKDRIRDYLKGRK